ncbi:MAG: VWA domain-containing protein, partial [Methylophilus methylotrophus]
MKRFFNLLKAHYETSLLLAAAVCLLLALVKPEI